MANPYYNPNFQGRAGQTARAEHVRAELDSVGTGFDLLHEIAKRAVLGAAGETLNALPNAAARAGRYLRFNAQGQPEAVQTGFTWKGNHTAGTAYEVGDVVRYGPYNSLYIAVSAHTAVAAISSTAFTVMIDLTGANIIRNEIRTGSFLAIPGGDYLIDSSAGNVDVGLPVAASILDAPINITHIGGSLANGQRITVVRNGHRIMGLAEDLQVDTVNASFSLMYADTARGYRLRVLA